MTPYSIGTLVKIENSLDTSKINMVGYITSWWNPRTGDGTRTDQVFYLVYTFSDGRKHYAAHQNLIPVLIEK